MNKVFLIGRLTNEPELRESTNGTKQTKFTIAVNRLKEGADFISCIAWNKTAELINKYLHKGNQIALEGRIQTGSYDDKQGNKRYTTDVNVENITFIGNNTPVASDKEKDIVKQETDDPWKDMGSTFKTDEIELSEDDYPF